MLGSRRAANAFPQAINLPVKLVVGFMPGGGAANTSGALGKMGLSAGAFSKVGDDPNGAFLIRELARAGVDTAGVRVSPADSTPFTFVGIHPDGDRTFITFDCGNTEFAALRVIAAKGAIRVLRGDRLRARISEELDAIGERYA